MKRAVAWFAENRVAANLMMIIILVAGILSAVGIKKEIFPEMSVEMISVSVPYLGASPEEAEEGVCVRVEEAIQGLEGIKKMTSTAAEGAGSVLVEVMPGYDTRKLLDDVKSRVDAIETFPDQTEKPVIREVVLKRQVIFVGVSGDADEITLNGWESRFGMTLPPCRVSPMSISQMHGPMKSPLKFPKMRCGVMD